MSFAPLHHSQSRSAGKAPSQSSSSQLSRRSTSATHDGPESTESRPRGDMSYPVGGYGDTFRFTLADIKRLGPDVYSQAMRFYKLWEDLKAKGKIRPGKPGSPTAKITKGDNSALIGKRPNPCACIATGNFKLCPGRGRNFGKCSRLSSPSHNFRFSNCQDGFTNGCPGKEDSRHPPLA
ncbi:hypothetical protein VTK26DRAFT_884 [Humicola hyalothermophila]